MFNIIRYSFILLAYLVGAAGGFAWCVINKSYFIAICVLLLAWLGFFKAKYYFDKLYALIKAKQSEAEEKE